MVVAQRFSGESFVCGASGKGEITYAFIHKANPKITHLQFYCVGSVFSFFIFTLYKNLEKIKF